MNGVDYTRQLARDREYYRDTVKKNNEANEKRLEDNNDRNELIQEKQFQTFKEDKSELEKDYQAKLSGLQDKTRETLEANQEDYQRRLTEERDAFVKDSGEKRKDFDRRFNDIKSSYKKSFESEKDLHKDIQAIERNRYAQNIAANRNDSDARLKEYQEKMLGAGASMKEQAGHEREQLVRAHEDNLRTIQKDNANKRAELREHIAQDIKKTREVAEADAVQTKQYAADRMNTMQEKFHDRYEIMASDYSGRTAATNENQQRENLKTNRENQEKLLDVQRDFNRQMRAVELEKRRRDNGSGEFAEAMNSQKGLNDKILHENQMKNMRSKLVNSQRNYQERAEDEQSEFNDTLKTENKEATARMERKLNEVNAERISTIAHEKEKGTRQMDNLTNLGKQEKMAYEQQLMLERKNAGDRQTKLKENFNKSMMAMDEKNKATLDDVTKVANMDKAEFVKKVNEARNNEVFMMKREFDKMMDSTVVDYEKRLGNYQRENEQLKLTMDEKVQNIIDQTEKSMASQRKMFDERRQGDSRAQALMNDQRDYQHKNEVAQLNNSFQKKLDKMQTTSDTKLKLLTNDYENKLKELRSSTAKTVADKDIGQQMEIERMKQAYEAEKMRIISGFDNQIAEMKRSHQNQVDQLKEYKKLS